MLNEILSTIFQILVVILIPFLFYVIKYKTLVGFFNYIGLKGTTKKANFLSLIALFAILVSSLGIAALSSELKEALTSQYSVAGKLKQMGLNTASVTLLLIIALFRTSLSEEIFFRGFVAKRLTNRLGFQMGNLVQAAIFGLMHLLMVFMLSRLTALLLVYAFVFSAVAGYIIGYIKEKAGNDSIIPGWIAHGLGNAIAYYLLAFVL